MFISALQPTLNQDQVKFQRKWTEKKISLFPHKTKPSLIVHKAGTDEVLMTDNKYRKIASYLGITRYNTMMERLNNSKVQTYSTTLNSYVTFLQEGMSYTHTSLKGHTLISTPISGVDLFSLPEGIIALSADKKTQYKIFLSTNHAAYLLDGKVDSQYISRYINVEKLVKTREGSFYFVSRPDYVSPKSQFRQLSVKGTKVPIVIYDTRYKIHVQFESKAEVSEFLWGHRSGAGSLSRYLYRNTLKATSESKDSVLYKKTLKFYYLNNLPKETVDL